MKNGMFIKEAIIMTILTNAANKPQETEPPSDETKIISGHNCRKIVIPDGKGGESICWEALDLISESDKNKVTNPKRKIGISLQTITQATRTTAIEVTAMPIEDSMFSYAGYTITDKRNK